MNRSLANILYGFSLRGLLVDALDGLLSWQARARQAHHMRSLDDRQLKDIGLSRADIERILRAGARHL